MKKPIQLSTEQTIILGRILHWLKVIRDAGTMKEIRLGSMRYGQKGDMIYTIKFLIDGIEWILRNEWYLDSQQDWLNGIYKWHKDNSKNLENSYS